VAPEERRPYMDTLVQELQRLKALIDEVTSLRRFVLE
jgi:hypothetical protein